MNRDEFLGCLFFILLVGGAWLGFHHLGIDVGFWTIAGITIGGIVAVGLAIYGVGALRDRGAFGSRVLRFEGREFPMTQEGSLLFPRRVRKHGRAAMLAPFSIVTDLLPHEMLDEEGAGPELSVLRRVRVICARCRSEMPSFLFEYAMRRRSQEFLFAVGHASVNPEEVLDGKRCPVCGSLDALFVGDDAGPVGDDDRDAVRDLTRECAHVWWGETGRVSARCDECGRELSPGEGFLDESKLRCERCMGTLISSGELRIGLVARARRWRAGEFEPFLEPTAEPWRIVDAEEE